MSKKKWIIVASAIIIISAAAMGGYIWYQNDQRQKILDSIQLTFTDQTVVEYGSDIKAEDFVDQQSGRLMAPTLDTMSLGQQTLEYKVTKGDLSKTFEHVIEVRDTQLPEIQLSKDSVNIEYGDAFDVKSYIQSVKDSVDGPLTYVSKDKVKDKQTGYYTYENNVNTKKAGTYKVVVKAVDKNNNQYHDVRHLTASLSGNIMGYRNTDFDAQSYVANDGTTKNYFPHGTATADYACIVTSSEITSSNGTNEVDTGAGNYTTDLDTILNSAPMNIRKAYYTALFRERCNSYKSLALS